MKKVLSALLLGATAAAIAPGAPFVAEAAPVLHGGRAHPGAQAGQQGKPAKPGQPGEQPSKQGKPTKPSKAAR